MLERRNKGTSPRSLERDDLPETSKKPEHLVQDVTVDEFGCVIRAQIRMEEDRPEPARPKRAVRKSRTFVQDEIEIALKSQQAATTRRSVSHQRQDRGGLVRCPHCGAHVASKNMLRHFSRVHQEKPQQPPQQTVANPDREMVTCPTCAAKVRQDRLSAHMTKLHRTLANPAPARRVPKPAPPKARLRSPAGVKIVSLDETLDQDGGKYLGYFARENGQFGSIPMYDDHSDEVGAD